jgi:hypothetical protein
MQCAGRRIAARAGVHEREEPRPGTRRIGPVGTARRASAVTLRRRTASRAGLGGGRGLGRPKIARTIGITLNTVASVSKSVYRKLGVNNRAQLAERMRLV